MVWVRWISTKFSELTLRIVQSCQSERTVQITTSWNILFLKVRFKFYKIYNVEIGANFVICPSEMLTVLEQWTCFRRISYASYLRLQISPHNSIQYGIVCDNWGLFTFLRNSRARGKYLCGTVRIISLSSLCMRISCSGAFTVVTSSSGNNI